MAIKFDNIELINLQNHAGSNVLTLNGSNTNVTFSGTVTATYFYGDGSNLTNISASDNTKLPLAGGTMSGGITMSGNSIAMGNGSINNANTITINDPGYQEGITWLNGNGWGIWESPDNMANSAGSLQFSVGTLRQMTLDTSGVLETRSAQIVDNTTGSCVAHWSTSGNSTGAIKVTIPGTHSSNWSMLILRVAVYEYNGNEHTIFYVSGHDWTSGWYNNGVTKWGDSDKEISVAYDSNDDYIIIGDVSSTWSYGHVTVDVVAHPSFYHSAMDITSGWAISQVTSLSGITVQSVSNKLVADRDWVNAQGFLTSSSSIPTNYLTNDAFDQGIGLYLTAGSFNAGTDTATTPLVIDEGDFIKTKDGSYLRNLIGKTTGDEIQIGQSGTALIDTINLLPGTGGNNAVKINSNTVWNAGNDGSGSGLDADTVDGHQGATLMRSNARKIFNVGASGAQAKRHTVGRLYYCGGHWGSDWQNIRIRLIEDSYSGAYVDYHIFGYYNGSDNQTLNLKVVDFRGLSSDNQRYKVTLGAHTDAGWDHSSRNVYYSDLYIDVAYYKNVRVIVETDGHTYQTSNPTSGGWATVLYSSISSTNISDFTDPKTTSYIGDGSVIWNSGNDGASSGLDADKVDGIHASSFLRSDTQDAYTPKRIDFGASSGWDAVGFGNITNLHVQGHNQFWFGAGNGTWFTGTANTKNSASGLAADASNAHDLLITTMQATATTDRGITFAVDSGGAGTSGYRLGKWHSSNEQHSSKLTIDGGLHVRGGDTANYDYYADDYSTYWDNQAGGAYWTGDTGWIDPSITAGNAIQIQAGNTTTNSNNPALQFHQYGYGGVQLRYDGPNDVMHLESTGSNRYDYFQNKTDHGYIQIGPMNTSHAHIYTDRSNFYFNKEIRVLGGCTVKQTEFSLGSGHKVVWNNGYGNPYIQDYYGSININAPLYLGASGNASQNLYAAGVFVNNNAVWTQGSTGLQGTNRISTLSNANNSVPSGFYQASSGTNYPTTGTWYNLLNVRHSNTGNDHGFQIAASYYNEDIWTRTYQGGSGANNGTYTTWRRLYHEGHKPTLSELGAAASSHTHSANDITSGTFSDLFAVATRYNIGLIDGSSSQTRDKLRVWSGGTYTIGMKSGFSYGHLGDYAMSFQMNNDSDRGFWWGHDGHSDAQGAMSLTTAGRLTVATSLSVGQGSGVTSPSSEALYVNGSAAVSSNITTSGGHFYGRSVNGTYSNIYRMGGIYFTWDSDSYGTNTHHSIRSTYGDSYGDDLTINSYHHLRINIDSNNNNTDERFEIGQNTTGTGNVRFQVTGTGNVYASADVIAYYSFSDKRLKTNIKPTTNNLEKVLKLEPVEYTWKDGKRDGRKEIGLVAQDVEKIVPEVVRENRRLSDDDNTLYKQVDYEHLVSTLIGAVQEQQDQIELLKAEIKELKNK